MLFFGVLAAKGKGGDVVQYFKKLEPPQGVTIRNIYFTLGPCDAIVVFEAPDQRTAMKFAIQTGLDTGYTVETLTAVQEL